jgi:hypothetical protein
MKRMLLALSLAFAGSAACYGDVKVLQGTVVSASPERGVLAVRDERAPHAVTEFRVAAAGAGAPGEVVRVAYRTEGDGPTVVRMMNITRTKNLAR